MPRIYISIGSNIDKERNIRSAIGALKECFGDLQLSSVYLSEAVGFQGDDFLNLVAACETDLGVKNVAECLRQIEQDHGRHRSGPKFSSRTLDLDLLLYGDLVYHEGKLELPRDEILYNAFVLQPLAEIAAELKHPVVGRSYGQLWEAFDKQTARLQPIDFDFSNI